MKNLFLVTLVSCLFSLGHSQDCSFYSFNEGAFYKYENYNSKGKLESSSKNELLSVTTSGNKTIADTKITVFDKKGKETYSSKVPIECDDSELIIDMKALIPQENMESFQNMEIDIQADNISIPSNASVGQSLNDGHMTITASSSGMQIGTFTFDITDRKVVSKEKIVVMDKSYEALKISYSFTTKIMIINKTFKVTEWYVDSIGMVKSETYKENGTSLISSTVLTEFKL